MISKKTFALVLLTAFSFAQGRTQLTIHVESKLAPTAVDMVVTLDENESATIINNDLGRVELVTRDENNETVSIDCTFFGKNQDGTEERIVTPFLVTSYGRSASTTFGICAEEQEEIQLKLTVVAEKIS